MGGTNENITDKPFNNLSSSGTDEGKMAENKPHMMVTQMYDGNKIK